MQGKTVEAGIAYADMGVKPGQTIRIAASEWHAAEGAFPEVALTLK